jgi:hypothetical protein
VEQGRRRTFHRAKRNERCHVENLEVGCRILFQNNFKYKICRCGKGRTSNESPEEEQKCSSTLSSTPALNGGGGLTPRPGRFTLGKETRYVLYRRLGGLHGRYGPHRYSIRGP